MGKRILFFALVLLALCGTVAARTVDDPLDDSAVYEAVPNSAILPEEGADFSEGIQEILSGALGEARTSIGQAAAACAAMMAVVLLCGVFGMEGAAGGAVRLAGTVGLAALFTSQLDTMLRLGTQTIADISEYGKVLLPVMAAAMTASGQPSSSAALYLGTAVFDTLLLTLVNRVLVPVVYVFLALSIANGAVGNDILKRLRELVKDLAAWGLRIILYAFTGYMTLTGVMSGKADASAVKAAKLAISTAVPVVGGILSDASEAVVLGADVVKGSAGLYGALVVLGICAAPFLRLGIQYLMLKGTAAVCSITGEKGQSDLIDAFSQALGLILAMTGTSCLIQLISTVCFMKGAG